MPRLRFSLTLPIKSVPGRFRFTQCASFVLGLLSLAAHALAAAETFEPLILQDADPAGTHPGLTEFRSSKGLLSLQMSAVYATADVNGPNMPSNPALGTPDEQQIYPRLAYDCKDSTHEVVSFGGPFLRVQPGDRIHIEFTNALSTQRTNIHFHGLEVSPHTNVNGTYGDFVSRPYLEGTAPGNTRTYDFVIPATQPPGPYWYHAHVHGVAETQVACGLAGALYVEGSVPGYIKTLKERLAPLIASHNHTTASLASETLSEVTTTLEQIPHSLLVLKDYWTPGLGPINGPLEQSVNGKVTYSTDVAAAQGSGYTGTPYVIQYGAAEQLWDIVNESADNYYILQLSGSNTSGLGFYLLARDAVPSDNLLDNLVPQSTIFIPPSGRVTVIVPTDALSGTVNIVANEVNPLGDDYFQVGNLVGQRPTPWNIISLISGGSATPATSWTTIAGQINQLLALTPSFNNAVAAFTAKHGIDASYVMFEPPNPVPGYLPPEPALVTLYRLADRHGSYLGIKGPADPYDNYEPPIAHLVPGQPQRWIIQNPSTEWHMFHIHQVHFRVERYTVVDDLVNPENNQTPPTENEGNPFYAYNEPPPTGSGKVVGQPYYTGLVDTVSIPDGLQVWITLPLNEGPQIAGNFVMHCHILNHEDAGMMANVVASNSFAAADAAPSKSSPHLAPLEVAAARFKQPAPLKDASGQDVTSDIFGHNDFSLVTFGYTTCEGACPMTVEKCVSALGKLSPAETARISPFFVSLDVERDNSAKLGEYAKEHELSPAWGTLLDTKLAASRAFGAQRRVSRKPDGSTVLRHTTTIYLIDRSMKIRAAFDEEQSAEEISHRIEKELQSSAANPSARNQAHG